MEPDLNGLLKKWLEGTLSAAEAKFFLKEFRDPDGIRLIEAWLQKQYDLTQNNNQTYFSNNQKNKIYEHATGFPIREKAALDAPPQGLTQIKLPYKPTDSRRNRKKGLIRLLTSLSTLACLFFIFYKINRPPTRITANNEQPSSLHDKAAPALSKPTISWGNLNKAVAVDQAIKEQSARLHKATDGCLVFTAVNPSAPPSIVSVPRGSLPVLIQLPDGSKVWINTGSTLQFPSAFVGDKRTVSLSGEAYFEVVHNNKQLFEVQQAGNTIAVLGTHFNINGYADNGKTKVTLLEGLVQVNHSAYLHHGEQAVLNDGNIHIQKEVDLQQVMAWKNNQFYFNGTSAQEILKQLSRWYAIDIVYKGNIPQGHYSGIISKNNSLSQVLTILEAGGMKFKLNQQSLWIY